MKLKKGFTLIELLIVIAIIGILSVALLPTITSGPQKARDAARLAAVNNIVNGIEQYNIEAGGYPIQSGAANNCMNFGVIGLGLTAIGTFTDIRSYLGIIPTVTRASWVGASPPPDGDNNLCDGVSFQFFYKSFTGGTAGNYMVAVQVERKESANYDTAVTGDASGLRTLVDKAAVLSATDAATPASGPYFYVVAK